MSELDVAFAGVVSGAVLGLFAPFVGLLIAKANRAHERRLAHDGRLFERRADVYSDLLKAAERVVGHVERTEPIMTPAPEPPALLSEDEAVALEARVAAFGSQPVLDALRTFKDAGRAFTAQLMTFRALRDHDPHSDQTIAARREMDEARRRVNATRRELQEAVRNDLTRLPAEG